MPLTANHENSALQGSDKQELTKNLNIIHAIEDHNDDNLDKALAQIGININYNSAEFPFNGDCFLIRAIRTDYPYAVKKLIEHKANVNVATHNGISAIELSIRTGNIEIIRLLLKTNPALAKTSPRLTNGSTTLLDMSLTVFSSHSLLEHGDWDNEAIRKKVLQEYNEGHDLMVLAFSPPEYSIIRYRGHFDLVGLLLEYYPEAIEIRNSNGYTPWELVNTPRKFKRMFSNACNNDDLNCITKDTDPNPDEATFDNVALADRNGEDSSIMVTVVYDLSGLKNVLEKAKKAPTDNKIAQQVIALHEQTSKVVKKVEELEHKSEEEHKSSEDFRQNARPIVEERMKKKLLSIEQDRIDLDPIQKAFRSSFNTKLRGAINGSVVLAGGDLQRKNNKKGDYLKEALSFISSHIPVFGAAVGLLAKGVAYYTDWTEEKRHKQIARFFDNTIEQEDLSQELAIEITKACIFLNDNAVIKNKDKAEDLGEMLAAAAYLVILTAEDKKTIKSWMGKGISESGILDKYFVAYAQHQTGKSLTANDTMVVYGFNNSKKMATPIPIKTSEYMQSRDAFNEEHKEPSPPRHDKPKKKKEECLVM